MPSMDIDYRYPDRRSVTRTLFSGVRSRFRNVEVEKRNDGLILVDINDFRVYDSENGFYRQGLKNVFFDLF